MTLDDGYDDEPLSASEDAVRDEVEETEPEHDPRRVRVFDEHGQRWAECLDCGKQWGAHLAEKRNGEETVWLEEVSAGDGSCGTTQ